MPRLPAISPEHAAGRAKELLDGVQATLGMIPNLMRTMANSPAVLEAYLPLEGQKSSARCSEVICTWPSICYGFLFRQLWSRCDCWQP